MIALLIFLALFGISKAAPLYNLRRSSSPSAPQSSGDWIAYTINNVEYVTSFQTTATSVNSSTAYQGLSALGRYPFQTYTVLSTNASNIDQSILTSIITNYGSTDDVWSSGFLSNIYLIATSKEKVTLSSDACTYMKSQGTTNLLYAGDIDATACTGMSTSSVPFPSTSVPQGPYVGTYGNATDTLDLFSVYRLYVDEQNTFLNGMFANSDSSLFYPLELYYHQNLLIPVTSRLYSLDDARPLAGMRFAVKDLYAMNGLVTTAGDKQYGETFGVANVTCYAVQRLIDLGAVPVGKAKTAPFASGEENELWQWYSYPLNARGDGFQTCSASSSGPGCAIGAYDWLDFAIGTDTGESVRRPSAVNGIYGGRPTEGIIPLTNVIPLSAYEDTAGAMARDPYLFQKIITNWYAQSNLTLPNSTSFPKKLYFPTDYFVGMTPANLAIVNNFISELGSSFGVVRQDINFTQFIFNQNATYSNMSNLLTEETQYQFDNLQLGYIETFMAKNGGRFPSYDTQWRAAYEPLFAAYQAGQRTNATYYADALLPKQELVQFIETSFFKADSETCSDSIMVYDIGYGGMPFYREDDLNPLGDYWQGELANETLWMYAGGISPATTTPDYVIPLATTPYMSNVSMIEEQLPVTLNLIARPGCDFMLVNWMVAMADKGLIKKVNAGRTLF